ncbi:MAG: tetratricopeptide repeat protein [Leptospirillum sp.]
MQFFQKGVLYLNASGSRLENRKKAYVCFRKAAMQGYSWGEVWLGILYYNGWGVGINHEKARKWWKQAAEQGNPWAQDRFNAEY